MTKKPKKLSDTARALLTAAAARDDRLIQPPRLPAAAARQVVRSMLNIGLAAKVPAPTEDADYVWRRANNGSDLTLRATQFGLACLRAEDGSSLMPPTAATLAEFGVGADDAASPEPPVASNVSVDGLQPGLDATEAPWQPPAVAKLEDATHAPPLAAARPGRRNSLRQAAQALLAAWDASASAMPWTNALPACAPLC